MMNSAHFLDIDVAMISDLRARTRALDVRFDGSTMITRISLQRRLICERRRKTRASRPESWRNELSCDLVAAYAGWANVFEGTRAVRAARTSLPETSDGARVDRDKGQ
jgi:hypothetical protein